jgi:4-hydroxybenzoate polyprenyltransferase
MSIIEKLTIPVHGARIETPLCVDLDGTLVYSDTLADSVASLSGNPGFFRALGALLSRGRAAFKHEVAKAAKLDVETLPYNEDLIAYLQGQREAGRYLVLATAADHSIALGVANHLRLFDEVIASDGVHNLKGSSKAEALVERFGEQGFAYAGNDASDIAVWKHASSAILVNTASSVARKAETLTFVEAMLAGRPGQAKPLLRAMRPHQWLKNVLVFLPIFTAHALGEWHAWFAAALTFFAFCATASSIYLINDATDLAADRRHPRKRKRPLASGTLPLSTGLLAAVVLAAGGLGLALLGGSLFVVLAYAVMSVTYSVKLKELPLVDVFMLAALYTIRVFAGAVATGHELSLWLLGFSGFLFLGLALLKRISELTALSRRKEQVPARRGYTTADLGVLQAFGCGASFASSLVLALFVQRETTAAQYASPTMLWGIVPLMLFWQCRLWLSTARGYMHDDPIVYSGRDWVTWLIGASVLCLLVIAHTVSI